MQRINSIGIGLITLPSAILTAIGLGEPSHAMPILAVWFVGMLLLIRSDSK